MPVNHYSVPIASLTALFAVLLIAGILLTLPLYRFDYRRFIKTRLFIKIIFWIPIFTVFTGLLYMNNTARLAVWIILLLAALSEFSRTARQKKTIRGLVPVAYFSLFGIALMHFYVIGVAYKPQTVGLLITIGFASVISDVAAFFMGNYLGRHKLPAAFNKSKSWEGVAGQLIGAWAGVVLVNAYVVPAPVLLFLPIGFGAAAGDLANSYVKRSANIKDWSDNIPGHGGYLDRLSSLAGSAAFTFYFVKLTGIL